MKKRYITVNWLCVAAVILNLSLIAFSAVGQATGSPETSAAPASVSSRQKVALLSEAEVIEKYALPTVTPGEKMTLAAAMKAADERNLDLLAMKAEIAVAKGRLKTAWGGILPVIQGKMGYTVYDHEDQLNGMVVNPQHDVDGGIEAYLPIIHPQGWWGIKVAKKAEAVTEMNVEAVRQQMLLQVAQAYFSCLMAEKLIHIHLNTLVAYDYSRRVAESRFTAGAGLRIDVVRADTDIETARQQLIMANLSFDDARDALAVLTDTEGLPMPADPGALANPEEDTATLEEQALKNRSDIKAVRGTMDLQNEQIRESYMQFLPYLTASWSGTYQFTEPGETSPDDRSRMAAMFSLVVPIYDHYRYGDVDIKRATLRKSEFETRLAERKATKLVRQARRSYLSALAAADAAKKQSLLAKEALMLTEASYNAGDGNSLEVSDARRTALEADVNFATKEIQVETALLGIIFAIGDDLSILGQ